jgi:polysaccharide export outer membrane protein
MRVSVTGLVRFAILLAVAAFCGACPTPISDEYLRIPVDTNAIRSAITLGPGDLFEVRVFGEEKLSGLHRVSGEGTIHFPLVGEVKVDGLSPSEVSLRLQGQLMNGYIKSPFVTVMVKEYQSKKVYVLGQVVKPGTFPFEGQMNVVQAVTMAGGFTPSAKKNSVIVTRVDNGVERSVRVPVERISEGVSPNFLLQPGDIVFVPESVM